MNGEGCALESLFAAARRQTKILHIWEDSHIRVFPVGHNIGIGSTKKNVQWRTMAKFSQSPIIIVLSLEHLPS